MMGNGKGNDAAVYRVLIAVAAAGAIAAICAVLVSPHLSRKAPETAKPAVHSVAPKPVTGKMQEIPAAPVTSPATTKTSTAGTATVMRESKRMVRQGQPLARPSPSPVQARVHPEPAVTSNPAHLKSLGVPVLAERGGGLDVATLKAACQRDSAADLSERLGIKKGDGSGRPLLKAADSDDDQHLHASIGAFKGRPLSDKSFTVNVESTFR